MADGMGENSSIERQCYTVPEAAELLGISRNHGYEMARRGEIPVLRLGGRLVVPKASFDRMLGLTLEREAVNERSH